MSYREDFYNKDIKKVKCLICSAEVFKSNGGLTRHLKSKHSIDLKDYVMEHVMLPNENKCSVCGNDTRWNIKTHNFQKVCSSKCNLQSEDTKKAIKKAVREKYGVDNVSQVPEINRKRKDNNLKKYGTENVNSVPEINKRSALTKSINAEKKGAPNYHKDKRQNDKRKEEDTTLIDTVFLNFEEDEDDWTEI